jgi:hypothetical protein
MVPPASGVVGGGALAEVASREHSGTAGMPARRCTQSSEVVSMSASVQLVTRGAKAEQAPSRSQIPLSPAAAVPLDNSTTSAATASGSSGSAKWVEVRIKTLRA